MTKLVPLLVVMGVAGCGKTTLGQYLSQCLGWPFLEGDDFHPPANIQKMARGDPLTDEDRQAWIGSIVATLDQQGAQPAILACSALTSIVRIQLKTARWHCCHWLLLDITEIEARRRVESRRGHFMPSALVASQFDALEPPQDSLRLDAMATPTDNGKTVLDALAAKGLVADLSANGSEVVRNS
ncbi:MAG: gluconokinase, GntK/IdnK-type [Pseudomonadota bacterium]